MQFSNRSTKLTSSPLYVFFRKVKAAEAAGQKIISLGVGEPYYNTPDAIKSAGIKAIEENKTHYNPSVGSMDLRRALAEKYGVTAEEVAVSSGAKPFLGSVFWSLVDEGDSVFMAGPYYPPFFQIAESCGGKVVVIDTKPAGFKLTAELLEKSLHENHTEKKKHLIISSPNNPAGTVYEKAELKKIVELCERENVTVISDECYVAYSSDKSFTVREFSDQVIAINSFSKAYAMTGWRVGYVVGPKALIETLGRFLDCYVGNPCSIADAAAVEALKQPTVPDFNEQRQIIHAWLTERGIAYSESEGGIFIFPDFSLVMERLGIKDSVELASYFLEKAEVAATPGVSFGENYDTHLRLSYCLKPEVLCEGLDKLSAVI